MLIHSQIHSDFQLPHLSPTFNPLAQTYDPVPISNYIWNTSKLLLLSSDVEINSGPRPIDQNPVFCSISSNKINYGIQQDIAPTWSDKNCNAGCHQAYNGLSINQTWYGKNSGRSITWKCPQYGSGITEIVIPPPPIYELPSRPSAVGKSCFVCKNPIRTRDADLAYHCVNSSCDNVCHLSATCSGFINPRRTITACVLSTRVWHCHLHSSSSASAHPSTQPDISPPSLKSLLNQGLSLADAKSSKEVFAKCSAALRSNTVQLICSVCIKRFHQKCGTGPNASTRDSQWKCETCTILQQTRTSESTNCQLPGTINSSPSQPLPITSQNKLNIYQWNADGIRPKFRELRDRLINSDIDILAVQQSKLRKTDKTPFIEGYATIRKDRNNILGGGFLIFIQNDIVFEKLHSIGKAGMEVLSICLKANKSTWLELYNVYLTNTST